MTAAEVENDELVGTVLWEKLRVVRRLGGGGMGAVYEVEHLITKHRRALKILHRKYITKPRYVRRLIREAGVAGTLKTPYVVETFDAGVLEDGSAYVLMELLDGRSLLAMMRERGRVPQAELAGIMVQVCEGIQVAHEAGIIHRDLKPDNVYLTRGSDGIERVKILDFGISKFTMLDPQMPSGLTSEGTIIGTPFYMSPEQAIGARDVDGRTDVYALGVIMYEALTGILPYDADSLGPLFIKIHEGKYVPVRQRAPEIDPSFEEVVHRAMHRSRDLRHPTADALRAELVRFAPSGPVKAGRTLTEGIANDSGEGLDDMPRPQKTPRSIPPSALDLAGDDGQEERTQRSEHAAEIVRRDSRRPKSAANRAFIGAAAILAVSLAIAAALVFGGSSEPTRAERSAPVSRGRSTVGSGERAAVDPSGAVARRPAIPAALDAGAVEVAPAGRGGVHTKRAQTAAERAGLDPNPY